MKPKMSNVTNAVHIHESLSPLPPYYIIAYYLFVVCYISCNIIKLYMYVCINVHACVCYMCTLYI